MMTRHKLKVKAVIFDRDGVIIDTDPVVIDSAREAFKRLGFTLQEEDITQMIGRSYTVYKNYFLKKWDFDFDEYRKIQNELFYKNLDKVRIINDTLDLIKYLNKKAIPMAITTSSGREGTLLILNKLGIASMFKAIVTREDSPNLKPDPTPYMLTAKKLRIEPKYCVAIEDTALGVEAAKKAALWCVAIPNELTSNQDFSKADFVVKSADEIKTLLDFV